MELCWTTKWGVWPYGLPCLSTDWASFSRWWAFLFSTCFVYSFLPPPPSPPFLFLPIILFPSYYYNRNIPIIIYSYNLYHPLSYYLLLSIIFIILSPFHCGESDWITVWCLADCQVKSQQKHFRDHAFILYFCWCLVQDVLIPSRIAIWWDKWMITPQYFSVKREGFSL